MNCLTRFWSFNTNKITKRIHGLAFSSNGNLGAASHDGCAYIFDPNGNLLNRVCGNDWMVGASYSNGRFGFINNDGYAYITDENGNLIKKIHIGYDYDYLITMTPNGFMACKWMCAFFDFKGNKLWDMVIDHVYNGPSYYKGYWYVADNYKLLIIKDGKKVAKIVKRILYEYNDGYESVRDTAVCGRYLAVLTDLHLYLYNLRKPKNPREIWNKGELEMPKEITFSSDCKYIAVAGDDDNKLKIYDIRGNLVLDKSFGSYIISVAWWRDRIAVGLLDGRMYVYREGSPRIKFVLADLPSVTTAARGMIDETRADLGNR